MEKNLKKFVKKIPVIGDFFLNLFKKDLLKAEAFPGSKKYWEQRYSSGGNSGYGSYDKFAKFKAEVLNSFIKKNGIKSVIEFGCGDGNQLALMNYRNYLGFDVSESAIAMCRRRFADKSNFKFKLMNDYSDETAEAALSLDVIFHLVEDEIFYKYMRSLFKAGTKYVIIYSSNYEQNSENAAAHVKHRKFTEWINKNMPEWTLLEHIPNKYVFKGDYGHGSFSDFYFYSIIL